MRPRPSQGPWPTICVSRDAGAWPINGSRLTGSCSAIATGWTCAKRWRGAARPRARPTASISPLRCRPSRGTSRNGGDRPVVGRWPHRSRAPYAATGGSPGDGGSVPLHRAADGGPAPTPIGSSSAGSGCPGNGLEPSRAAPDVEVTFDERGPANGSPSIASQHVTTAAALDTRDYRREDPRCTEGPIPVQCRSCSCGTCWVGILDGAERLSPWKRASVRPSPPSVTCRATSRIRWYVWRAWPRRSARSP